MNQSFYQQLIDMYEKAPINATYTPNMTITSECTTIIIDVNPQHFHTANYLHGSAIFKLLDDSAYFSAQAIEPTYFLVTSSFTTHFIRPINSGQLIATGTIIDQTTTQIIAQSTIKTNEEKVIAHGTGCFMKSSIALST